MALHHYSTKEESNLEIVSRLESAIECVEEWGVPVPENSRFRVYLARLRPLARDAEVQITQSQMHQLQFDLREIDEFAAIVESFPRGIGEEAENRLRVVLTGSEHPDEESRSAARDTQWELYLRALFRRAQIPAGLGNPDVITTVRKKKIPVEAKRPKSEARLDDRLRKGVSQLEASGSPGVVALSLDHAIRDGRGVLVGQSLADVEAEVQRLVADMISRNLRQIVNRVRDRSVLGFIFHARVPTWIKPIQRPQLVTVNQIEPISSDVEVNAVIDRLLEGLATG
jgi:hypothetical protein